VAFHQGALAWEGKEEGLSKFLSMSSQRKGRKDLPPKAPGGSPEGGIPFGGKGGAPGGIIVGGNPGTPGGPGGKGGRAMRVCFH